LDSNVQYHQLESDAGAIMPKIVLCVVVVGVATMLALVCGAARAQSAAAGQTLYTLNCTSCHGAASNASPRKGITPSAINNAINSVSQMQFLKVALSATDIANIAAYISSVNTAAVVPAVNTTGMWYLPAEDGWGISMVQGTVSTTVFAVIYTYGTDNKATWFSCICNWTTPTSMSGDLYSVTGPVFNATPFDPNAVSKNIVGKLTVNFSGADNATIAYNVGAISVSKSVIRLKY
jgi:mono/diheme cytochrome c family protein